MTRRLLDLAWLCALLFAMDQLYRLLHPDVNLVRATLVGLTAFATLAGLAQLGVRPVAPARGAAAVLASAFGSVVAIEAGWLVSRSPASVAVHVALLALAWIVLAPRGYRRREASTARSSSSGTASTSGASPSSASASSRIVSQ